MELGPLQREIMTRLASATPTSLGGDVYDVREVARGLKADHHQPAVSLAVRQLVERGALVSMTRSYAGDFRPDDGWEDQVRFVRRAAGR